MACNMFAYATSLAIVFLLTLTLTRTQSRIVPSDANVIDQTCQQTPNYAQCKKFLNSDVAGLALILVDQLKNEATKSAQFVKQNRGKFPGLEKPLSSCDSKYDAILTADIPVVIQAIHQGNPKFAEGSLNDAAIEANSCEKGFSAGKSPLTDFNKLLNDISVIASAIVRLLL